ncbi:carboxypeptidase-like regulatory domain-containing protein [Lutibacter sp. A80]|uniref:carboxypeptidase-like regulatory domain-containing protein n=1 Tax=Lutibacter sp. A80 TaxID=2918453 RepID=UPI001F05EFE5|nr:carboxypeptidase-like regulatory domain-containing protein [Lutibacter sp. A80]UMB59693.1 carboxypeptidase-like regulatory domain-containing protein [Lutibacter sp. A80]
MKKILLTTFFLFSTFLSFSQYIEGKVVDAQTNKPIEGVNVFLDAINRGAVTNEKGVYYLKFPYEIVKSGTIRFSHITYKEVEIPYTQEKKEYSVSLLIDLQKLEEVNLSYRRNLKKTISYKTLSSMKNAVHSFGSLLKDGKIYVVGGDASFEHNQFKKVMEYDPDRLFEKLTNGTIRNYKVDKYKGDLQTYDLKKDVWTRSKSKFRKRAYHNLNLYTNKIVVLGGKNISANGKFEYLDDKIEIFNIEKDTIIIDHTNPHQAINFASFTYKDKMILMGGSIKLKNNGLKEYSNKVHLYDFKTGNWYKIGNMPIPKEVKGVLVENKIYLIGGSNKRTLTSIEVFDLKTQKWTKEGNLFYGINKPALTYHNNIIYIFNNGKINTYNTITKELNEYLIELSLEASELFYANNKLYILGGFKENNFSLRPSKGLYSVDLNEFNNTRINNSKTL